MTDHQDRHDRRDDRPGRIRVEGRASRWVTADHADVTFTVRRNAPTSAKAVALASEAYAILDGVLAGAGDVVERRTTVALSVHQVTRWDPETGKEHRDGFVAARAETVRFSPPAEAGEVLRAIAIAVPDLGLTGPVYGLRAENPVHDEVRAAAAADARRVAASYASGLGLSLGRVLRITEPGLSGGRGGGGFGEPRFAMAAPMAEADSSGPSTVLVDLTSEDVEVRSVVELDVAIGT